MDDAAVLKRVFVSIPYNRLKNEFLPLVLERGVRPEIGLDAMALSDVPDAFQTLAKALAQRGLQCTVHMPFMDLCAGSQDPGVLELMRGRYRQAIAAARFFEPILLVCHTGWDSKRHAFVEEKWLDTAFETFNMLADELESALPRTRLVIENVYEQRPRILLALLKRLSGRAGFCLDMGHARVFSLTPAAVWIKALGRRLEHLHLHDNLGELDDHMGLGAGDMDFEPLWKHLSGLDTRPTVTLEAHSAQGLWKSIRYLAKGPGPWLYSCTKEF